MKTILMMMLMVIAVSCGKHSGSSSPYLYEVSNFNKQWNYFVGTGTTFTFDAIDLSDMNNVTVTNLHRNGVTATCTYSATRDVYNEFYGTLTFTYLTGDMFVCSQMVGSFTYEAAHDTSIGVEYLKISNLELR